MTTQAVKQWLNDQLVSSATVNPGTYPRNAVAGMLYSAGQISGSTLAIVIDRPVQDIDIEAVSAIFIDVPGEEETQVTTGGLNGTFKNVIQFQIDMLWAADLTGDPQNNIAPLFTDELVAKRQFRKYVQALRKTVRACIYQLKSAGLYQAGLWAVTDPDDGTVSRIAGIGTSIKVKYNPPMIAENATDIFFGAMIQFSIVEQYSGTGL